MEPQLEERGSAFRTPLLAVAVGIYLPFQLKVPTLLGGILAWAAGRALKKNEDAASETEKEACKEKTERGLRNGVLFSAGLITGEALVGILMAIPIVMLGVYQVAVGVIRK